MSKAAIEHLRASFGDRVLSTSDFRGDDEAVVAPKDWVDVATFLRDDAQLDMDHFIDLTAVDRPERNGPRFDVLVFVRSMAKNHRVRIRTHVADGEELATLCEVWPGANWAEREVFDMFGISFAGHPDLRRILMYEQFEGYPLRKDYPIEKTQPLIPYREVAGVGKLPPFGLDEGQPWGRIDWERRLAGEDRQVSPAIGVQVGQRRTLSDSEAAEALQAKIARTLGDPTPPEPPRGDSTGDTPDPGGGE